MLSWVQRFFFPDKPLRSDGNAKASAPHPENQNQGAISPAKRIDQLYVLPDDGEDFDVAACERLLQSIASQGAVYVPDVCGNVFASLEEFFEGNRSRYSIAANVDLDLKYESIFGWYDLLKSVRDTEGVSDVFVAISMIEPYEDGRIGLWPYSDSLWVYSSLNLEDIRSLLSPLQPDMIASEFEGDSIPNLHPPFAVKPGERAYWVWWD